MLEREKPGATIVPIIISSDKTQLTQFRNKSAYPVYLTIGNLPKDIRRKPSRRGQILLGYLPTTRLEHIKSPTSRHHARTNLFHSCMRKILQPLETAGVDGLEMASGDGVVRRCHPIFATFVGDYPEQVLVTCCKYTHCPKCPKLPDEFGDDSDISPLRDLVMVLAALDTLEEGPTAYACNCADAGIKAVHKPFWQDLPYVNIFRSITSDILHQLYQGMIKHLLNWLKQSCDPAEIDACCRRLPPNHNLWFFSNGITLLSCVSGKEHSDMCRILLGLIIGMRLPQGLSPNRLVRAVRSMLDFLYLAQLPSHTTETLGYLRNALTAFHENKSIFVDLGVRKDFEIPKLHSLQHYIPTIEEFGTTDNYNTEYSERLHIDFAKDAYRATNHKNEYPQMTLWLERKEKVLRHQLFIEWRISRQRQLQNSPPDPILHTHIKITRWPSVYRVSFDDFAADYGAADFRQALTVFIANYNNPNLNRTQLQHAAFRIILSFQRLPAFHKLKFWNEDPQGQSDASDTLDVAHVRPQKRGKNGSWIPAWFDTVLVNINATGLSGVAGGFFSLRHTVY